MRYKDFDHFDFSPDIKGFMVQFFHSILKYSKFEEKIGQFYSQLSHDFILTSLFSSKMMGVRISASEKMRFLLINDCFCENKEGGPMSGESDRDLPIVKVFQFQSLKETQKNFRYAFKMLLNELWIQKLRRRRRRMRKKIISIIIDKERKIKEPCNIEIQLQK